MVDYLSYEVFLLLFSALPLPASKRGCHGSDFPVGRRSVGHSIQPTNGQRVMMMMMIDDYDDVNNIDDNGVDDDDTNDQQDPGHQ